MKTVQDWGFISKEQGLVKPKLQENKIFHALTAAYENKQQQEIYGATENIVRREKELCEMALGELGRLSDGKGEGDDTLRLIVDHYQSRLRVAKEKEEKINHLSEDSRKMSEEYKKKTQELAEVKRSLMDSQSKLRELAKSTEKLIKKEEELRFIEENLRSELEKNKRNIINGLYEIVVDLSEAEPSPPKAVPAEAPHAARPAVPPPKEIPGPPAFPASRSEPMRVTESPLPRPKPEGAPRSGGAESLWTGLRTPVSSWMPAAPAPPPPSIPEGGLLEKANRLKLFEPGKAVCSKSLVKTQEGEVISEYFYSALHPKDARHYIFNSLYGVSSLLALKARDGDAFQDRLETVFTDLLSRLEHGRNIHLEAFLAEQINTAALAKLLAIPRQERGPAFEALAAMILARLDAVGASRAALIENQFREQPKPSYPSISGLSA